MHRMRGGDRRQVFAGLDLGGTKIQAVLLDEAGNVLSQCRRATRRISRSRALGEFTPR